MFVFKTPHGNLTEFQVGAAGDKDKLISIRGEK